MANVNREFWESARINNWSFRQYYYRLVELAVSMFEWKNVPDTIDVRYLELALFTDGAAVFSRMKFLIIWRFALQEVDHLMCIVFPQEDEHTPQMVTINS